MSRIASKEVVVAVMFVAATIVSTVLSYRYSDSITVLDSTVCTDQGLFSFQIPLCRLASTAPTSHEARRFVWNEGMWKSGTNGGKCALRVWMTAQEVKESVPNMAMVADFGYWVGGWQSEARPGPFIVVFAPIWFVWLIGYLMFLAIVKYKPQFSIRILFIGISLMAVLLWAITLRSSETDRARAPLPFQSAQACADGDRLDRVPNMGHNLTGFFFESIDHGFYRCHIQLF